MRLQLVTYKLVIAYKIGDLCIAKFAPECLSLCSNLSEVQNLNKQIELIKIIKNSRFLFGKILLFNENFKFELSKIPKRLTPLENAVKPLKVGKRLKV